MSKDVARIKKTGNSLTVNVSKICKESGLKEGDLVEITIRKVKAISVEFEDGTVDSITADQYDIDEIVTLNGSSRSDYYDIDKVVTPYNSKNANYMGIIRSILKEHNEGISYEEMVSIFSDKISETEQLSPLRVDEIVSRGLSYLVSAGEVFKNPKGYFLYVY